MPTWMLLGILAFVTTIVLFAARFRRSSRSRAALLAGVVNLLVAGINSSAPFRGLLDGEYVGYHFGLLYAPRGIAVFLVAGLVLVSAAAAAYLAGRNQRGRGMGVVAIVDGALALNLGIGVLLAARTTSDFRIQFGEFLTIPSAVSIAILLLVLIGPLALISGWAARQAGWTGAPRGA